MTARVLVVDDVPANVKLLEARLSAEYFDVVTAMNGQEALAICERAECDIVLLDVMMPGMDGFEVCRRMKGDPETAHIPVVMVTALSETAAGRFFEELAANAGVRTRPPAANAASTPAFLDFATVDIRSELPVHDLI